MFLLARFAWLLFQALVFGSLLTPVVFFISRGLFALLKKHPAASEELHEEKDFAIIIKTNGSTEETESLVQSLLKLNYTNYLIYIVTDNFFQGCFDEKVVVLPSEKNNMSRVRFFRYLIENFKRPHTHLTILNSDCIVHSEYLNQLNVFFNEGYGAVQSAYSLQQQDSLSLLAYLGNSYQRLFKGELPFALGASASLTGSGAAFHISLFKQCLKRLSRGRTGEHFYQRMESELARRGHRIAFASGTVVYKVETVNAMQLLYFQALSMNRWFCRFAGNINRLVKGLLSLNLNSIISGVALLQPSLFTTLFLSVLCLAANGRMHSSVTAVWTSGLLLFLCCFAITVFRSLQEGNRHTTPIFFASYPANIFYREEEDYMQSADEADTTVNHEVAVEISNTSARFILEH